jgi:prophage regulatory protein
MSSFSPVAPHKGARATIPVVDIRKLAGIDGHPTASIAVSLYRLPQVLARIPVSRSAWFAGIQAGRYPRSYSLGPRTTVWRSDDIDLVIESLCS